MQKELSSATKKIKGWIRKEKVLDVILFGSSARSKMKPKDVDLCILICDNDEEKSIELVNSLADVLDKEGFNFHINILASSSFVKGDTLAKTLLNEGVSIKKGEPFSSTFSLNSKSLFVYSLQHFSPSQRVRFHYMLNGRYGSKGVLNETEGKILGTGTIIVPTSKEDILKEVFDTWGVRYKIERILVS